MFLAAESHDKEQYKNQLERHRIKERPFEIPVIIVAGSSSGMNKTKSAGYREIFMELMHGFKGTIISGGTTAGIPGLVGEVKLELEKKSAIDFSLIAYLPKKLPENSSKSTAYDCFYETDSDHFSVP